jgi:WbqC-like protein family
MHSFQIVTPEYLPVVTYFLPFLISDTIIIADHIQYKKKSAFTRASLFKNDIKITIPVKNKGFGQPICEKEIAYIENWDRCHLRSIYHQYHMLPYFDDYYFKLQGLYNKKHKYLNIFLYNQISLFLSDLKINCNLRLSSGENFSGSLEESLIRFSDTNSIKNFVFSEADVLGGFINLDKFYNEKIHTKALPKYNNSSLEKLNILEFLFLYGPEAAFKLREV